MSLDQNGSIPEVIIQFGGEDSGLCDLYFDNKVIAQLSNNPNVGGKALHKFSLDPMVVLGSASAKVSDLQGKEIGCVVVFANLDPDPAIQFSFLLDVRQSNTSVITPVNVTNESPDIVKNDDNSMQIFKRKSQL